MQINVYSHGFEISRVREVRERSVIHEFCKPLIQYELKKVRGRFVRSPARVYAFATKDQTRFRFHVNQLRDFIDLLAKRGFKEKEDYTLRHHDAHVDDFPIVGFKWKSPKSPREDQLPVIEKAMEPGAIKMIGAEPGFGKTLIALWIGKELGLRSMYMFKGGYVSRWVEAFEEYYDLEPGDLCVVRGSAMFINLMEDALNGATLPKIIVVTNRTMLDYLKDYRETNGKSKMYPIKPGELYQKLGIGYVVKDELHQEFHLNYRIDLFTHTLKSVSLSGTLESTDQFMERIYDIGYPVVERIVGGASEPYIAATALLYELEEPNRAKYMGPMGYSHNKFENYIMGNKKLLERYLDMFVWVTKVYYDTVMEPGQKMLHFCSSVEMCLLVRDHLRKAYPHFVINKYTEEDNYEVLLESDISVSTVLSAGTAVDIPGLLTTYMSIAIDSVKSNKQALGRTRRFKDRPDIFPNFVYAVCMVIQKHVDYHYNKRGYFRGKVVSHKERRYYHKI